MVRKTFLPLLAVAALTIALDAPEAAAAGSVVNKHPRPVAHRAYHAAAATLPYGPEYGFLRHIPPNAIRMPGYIFVPGVGILGASCDLPTSACPNEYRDIR
jgi:hypothetical protein